LSVPAATRSGVPQRRVRKRPPVRLRPEQYGALAYASDLDRFTSLDHRAAALTERAAGDSVSVDHNEWPLAQELIAAGILESASVTACPPRTGPSLVGGFTDLPPVTEPIVVNAFATALCPLLCRYCHADDLMLPFRAGESDEDIERVQTTAAAIPAMVAVITGGDPILRPERTARLINHLSPAKAIVVDTSGAGDIASLMPVLKEHQAHLRVSVDSADRRVHDRLRPVSPRFLPRGTSSHAAAWATIERALRADVAVTVQTVVTQANEDEKSLLALAARLAGAGVRNWVLHIAVPAGKAADPRNQGLLPSTRVSGLLARITHRIEADDRLRGLRIRVTATHTSPNAVLLVGSRGDVYVETGPGGKVKLTGATSNTAELLRLFRENVDLRAHANRYLGGTAPFS
jgi:molybdenum cofactor biosynthesis enzyme MoaA